MFSKWSQGLMALPDLPLHHHWRETTEIARCQCVRNTLYVTLDQIFQVSIDHIPVAEWSMLTRSGCDREPSPWHVCRVIFKLIN